MKMNETNKMMNVTMRCVRALAMGCAAVVFCVFATSAYGANEVRIATGNGSSATALTQLKEALANPEVETIILEAPTSGKTAMMLPNGTVLASTSAKRKLIRVEKPFMPEDGYVVISNYTNGSSKYATLVRPQAADYSTYRLFEIQANARVVISNVTLMGGFCGSRTCSATDYSQTTGGIENFGNLEMYNVDLLRTATAMLNRPGARALLVECNFVRNANWYGGGILNFNSQQDSAAVATTSGTLVMDRCSLSENQSLGLTHGGGALENQGLACINNCVIANNASTEIGGAINNCKGGHLYVMNTTIVGNVTSLNKEAGGGIGNAGKSKNVQIVNSFLAYNGYDNGSTIVASSLARHSASGDNVNITMSNSIYDQIQNMPSSTYYKTNNSITRYEGLVYALATNSVISAGLVNAGGETSNFVHPQLASANVYADPYSLEPVMAVQAEDHEIFEMAATTYFDYSGMWDTTPSILMSYVNANGNETKVGEKVRVATSDEERDNSIVAVAFSGDSRLSPNYVGAVKVPVLEPEVEDGEGDIELYWIQAGAYANGKLSGVTIYRDTYRAGSVVTVKATPDSAYYLAGWMVNGKMVADTAQKYIYSIVMNENIVVAPVFAPVKTQIIAATQRYPWNNLVDIDYSVAEEDAANYRLVFTATYIDSDTNEEKTIQLMTFVSNKAGRDENRAFTQTRIGDDDNANLRKAGLHRVTWDSAADGLKIKGGQVSFRLRACEGEEQ